MYVKHLLLFILPFAAFQLHPLLLSRQKYGSFSMDCAYFSNLTTQWKMHARIPRKGSKWKYICVEVNKFFKWWEEFWVLSFSLNLLAILHEPSNDWWLGSRRRRWITYSKTWKVHKPSAKKRISLIKSDRQGIRQISVFIDAGTVQAASSSAWHPCLSTSSSRQVLHLLHSE